MTALRALATRVLRRLMPQWRPVEDPELRDAIRQGVREGLDGLRLRHRHYCPRTLDAYRIEWHSDNPDFPHPSAGWYFGAECGDGTVHWTAIGFCPFCGERMAADPPRTPSGKVHVRQPTACPRCGLNLEKRS